MRSYSNSELNDFANQIVSQISLDVTADTHGYVGYANPEEVKQKILEYLINNNLDLSQEDFNILVEKVCNKIKFRLNAKGVGGTFKSAMGNWLFVVVIMVIIGILISIFS